MKPSLQELIIIGNNITQQKDSKMDLKYKKLVSVIVDELRKIENDDRHNFSQRICRAIIDSDYWDDPFIQALWAYLEKRNHKQKTRT